MPDVVWINDREFQELGLNGINEVGGVWDAAEFVRGTVAMPGRAGGLPNELAGLNARILEIVVELDAASLTAREAALDSLDFAVVGRRCEIRFSDQPNKVIDGYYESGRTVPVIRNSFDATNPELVRTLRFQVPQPVKKHRYARVVSFGSARQAIELGTAPSSGTIQIMGAATDPVVTYRAANGATVGQWAFTASLSATEYLSIDLRLGRIDRVTNGAVANGANTYNDTGEFVSRIDPGDGDFDNASWPTLQVSSGNARYVYRKEYWS